MPNKIGLPLVGLSLFLTLFVVGCWDNRDVTELNFVTAVGLTRTSDGQIQLVVEIPNAQKVVSVGDGGGMAGKAVSTYSGTGETVFEAVRNCLKSINEKLVWTHLELIILGEDLAREGITQILDFFERDAEPSITAKVLLAKDDKVKELMNVESDIEKISSLHITNLIKTNQRALASTCEVELIDLLKGISNPGKSCLIPLIHIKEDKEKLTFQDIELEGVGLLRKDKLIGFLDSSQSRGWFITTGKANSTIYNVPHPFNPGKKVSFEMDHAQAKKKIELTDRQLKMKVDITAFGDIGETEASGDIFNPDTLNQITQETEQTIQKEVEGTFRTVQEYGVDIFGFGEIFRRKYTSEWQTISEQWDEVFREASVEVQVQVKIQRSGYIRQPTKPR